VSELAVSQGVMATGRDRSDKPHKRLLVWQEAMNMVERIYAMTEDFPTREHLGLAAQMRRAAVSIPSNIAEGAARSSNKEKLQFYFIARGSLSELDTQLEIAQRLGYVQHDLFQETLDALEHVSRLLQGLVTSRLGGKT